MLHIKSNFKYINIKEDTVDVHLNRISTFLLHKYYICTLFLVSTQPVFYKDPQTGRNLRQLNVLKILNVSITICKQCNCSYNLMSDFNILISYIYHICLLALVTSF